MKALKVGTDCCVSEVDVSGDVYSVLQELLNGWPEHVRPKRLKPPYCMMVDDEGVYKELPVNYVGSYLYQTDKHGHPIVGDIYIFKDKIHACGDYTVTGLTDEELEQVRAFLSPIVDKCAERSGA